MFKRFLVLGLVALFMCSCASKSKLIYFQGIKNGESRTSSQGYQPVLQKDDLLMIIVSAPNPEAAAPYNLVTYSSLDNSDRANTAARHQTYLVDDAGYIQFPVLGNLKVGGLTKSEAVEKIKSELRKYITSPIVNLRIINFKFSVMGEVSRPGSFNVETERITLPEALSMAGDLTIYGDRKNVLIIREENGVRTHNFIDITSTDFLDSPFYYVDQNDMIYVQPNQTRVNSSVVGPNISVIISVISLLITVITLATK